jgi:hypothetical protein
LLSRRIGPTDGVFFSISRRSGPTEIDPRLVIKTESADRDRAASRSRAAGARRGRTGRDVETRLPTGIDPRLDGKPATPEPAARRPVIEAPCPATRRARLDTSAARPDIVVHALARATATHARGTRALDDDR